MGGSDFERLIESHQPVLMEGSLVERLDREYHVPLDPHISNAALLLHEEGRKLLASLHREYIAIGRRANLPLLLLTPTWRANPERMQAAGITRETDLNAIAVKYLRGLRAETDDYAEQIYIGGLMGSYGDAYKPAEALSEVDAAHFHRLQATALADAGVDFLIASTLPAASEALGLAHAFASTGVPYIISYVVRPEGTLLDGTPLHEIISQIDSEAHPSPVTHMINCVHPTVFVRALEAEKARGHDLSGRIAGLQANTSARSPEELDGLDHLDSDAPDVFGLAMERVTAETPCRLLGGCCGTSAPHIDQIAALLNRE